MQALFFQLLFCISLALGVIFRNELITIARRVLSFRIKFPSRKKKADIRSEPRSTTVITDGSSKIPYWMYVGVGAAMIAGTILVWNSYKKHHDSK